jgi:hypothetical protein
VRKFEEELLQLVDLRFWLGIYLSYGLEFLLSLWLFLIGALALERCALLLHIIFIIPMTVNDVNLSVAFIGVSGLSS